MKRTAVLVMLVALLLLCASVAPAAAAPIKPLWCTVDMHTGDDHWEGVISGDINGTILFHGGPGGFLAGNTYHFSEVFDIYPYEGGRISGYDLGLWNFSDLKEFNNQSLKFRALGRVTETSDEWRHLLGAKFFEEGVTSDPFGSVVSVEDMKVRFN